VRNKNEKNLKTKIEQKAPNLGLQHPNQYEKSAPINYPFLFTKKNMNISNEKKHRENEMKKKTEVHLN